MDDFIQFFTLELEKIKDDDPNRKLLEFMVKFINEGIIDTGAPVWLVEADEILEHIKLTAEEKDMLVEELMAINDSRDIIKTAREDGFEEGIEQGIEQGEVRKQQEIISKLLNSGLSVEEVAELLEMKPNDIAAVPVGGEKICLLKN
jgi:predicted transposase/invertase (TIGR01784 family)